MRNNNRNKGELLALKPETRTNAHVKRRVTPSEAVLDLVPHSFPCLNGNNFGMGRGPERLSSADWLICAELTRLAVKGFLFTTWSCTKKLANSPLTWLKWVLYPAFFQPCGHFFFLSLVHIFAQMQLQILRQLFSDLSLQWMETQFLLHCPPPRYFLS